MIAKLPKANTASGQRRITRVFQDFCEIAALTLRNAVQATGWDEREARYLQIVTDYERAELDRFAEAMAGVALRLQAAEGDVLGRLYMELDLGNSDLGQFFTPYDVSLLIAKMTLGDPRDRLDEDGTITLHEPACGSGGMIIAAAQNVREHGLNPSRVLRILAQDLDITAVHMTYVQLSMLGLPARVVHGNTLTQEQHDVWPTPAWMALAYGGPASAAPHPFDDKDSA